MNKKLQNNIIKGNKSIWKENKYDKIAKNGLYEVYFLIFHDDRRKESYWIRYTLVCNKNSTISKNSIMNNDKGSGLLWFGYFNAYESNKNFMVKKSFFLDKVKGTYEIEDDYRFITIADSYLSLTQAIGKFTTKSGKIFSWELNFSNFQDPYIIVPQLAQKLGITNTINKATHPHLEISGKISMNGEEREITKVPGIQYHTYADKYSEPWEWFNCYTIKEWPMGYIDFSYKVNKGILEINNGTKSLTSWNNSVIKKLVTSGKLKREKSIETLTFKLENKQKTIEGKISVPKESIIGVEYVGPTDEKFYCYNSEIANGFIKITMKKGKKVVETIELQIKQSVAFETTYKKPVDGIKYLVWNDERFDQSK